MKISVQRDEAVRLAEYHAREEHGLEPVMDSDAAVTEWVQFTASRAVGCQLQEIAVMMRGDQVLLDASTEIIADLRLSWL